VFLLNETVNETFRCFSGTLLKKIVMSSTGNATAGDH
jgi:hypothetical protein